MLNFFIIIIFFEAFVNITLTSGIIVKNANEFLIPLYFRAR